MTPNHRYSPLACWLFVVGCSAARDLGTSFDYSNIFASGRDAGISFSDLPGFTRSVYQRDHALVTPESRVWAMQLGWSKATTAHVISSASNPATNFAMYLAKLQSGGASGLPEEGVERFVFVLDGEVNVTTSGKQPETTLHADDFVYFPPGFKHSLTSEHGAGLLIYETKYRVKNGAPKFQYGCTGDQKTLDTPGEIFVLRKLLPPTADYDFNIHVMDFNPGEFLNVKEVHYNQHGLLLLQGQGIYRLGDNWYPVQAGDAIWMGPYVPQWYAALGTHISRYIIYKDTTANPLL